MKHVVIVGAGVVAANLARGLLKKPGVQVTLMEAGSRVPMRDRRLWLDMLQTGRKPYAHLGDDDQDHTSTGPVNYLFAGARLFARGGSTLHWGGYSPRFKPGDFRLKSNFQGPLPEGSSIIDWPLSYEDMEPYYCRAEELIRVQGSNETSECLPWRSKDYPVNHFPFHKIVSSLNRGCVLSVGLFALSHSPGRALPDHRNLQILSHRCEIFGRSDPRSTGRASQLSTPHRDDGAGNHFGPHEI